MRIYSANRLLDPRGQGRPIWTPLQVFDDGTRTFIRFPTTMLKREAPAFFVLDPANQVQIVNVRVKNEYYIVDRLFERPSCASGSRTRRSSASRGISDGARA